ncbi:MAG: DNA polymerase III subunit epsilon [Pseudolabrys sp.]
MTIIRVIDLETTGFTAPEAKVCEIGWIDLVSTTLDLAGKPAGWRIAGPHRGELVNPGIPIPPITSAVHHLIDEDVASARTWEMVCADFFPPSDPVVAYAAHNIKMERQWITDDLMGGIPWVCSYKAALRVWPDAPSHSNQALRYWRRPAGLSRELAAGAHRAAPDAYVTAHLLLDLLETASLDQLIEWSSQPVLLVRCHIGKERGKLWADIESGFLRWLLDKDFDEDVKFTARHHLELRAKAA